MNADSQNLRLAIAGCGGIAAFHARAIREIPGVELVGAAARSAGKAQAFCAEFGGRPYLDLAAMLDGEKPDVLCVTTPSGAHWEAAEAAASRGIHVMCEKPLEISGERMEKTIDICAKHGVQLGAIFQQRMGPLMQALHGAVRAGRFGAGLTLQASVPWWRDDAYYGPGRWQGTRALDGGGALMNQAIHAVDLLLWLARANMPDLAKDANPVAQVSCFAGCFGHAKGLMEVEDTAVVNLKLKNGLVAQLLASTGMYPGSLRRFLVAGRDGTAEVLEDQLLQWAFRHAQPEDEHTLVRFGHGTGHGGGAGDPFALSYANHRENMAAFLACVRSGEPFALSGAVAKQAVDVILAAYKSSEAGGAPVEIKG